MKLWIGQIVSNLGDEVAFFGIGVLIIFSWQGTAVDLSIVMIASSIPILVFGPLAGVYVDRWNRKSTMIIADILRGFLALLFIICTSVLSLAIVIFLISTVSRFFYPARMAMIPEIVKSENLTEANSLSQMTYMLSVILGPIIGATTIYIFGYLWVFIFDSASYFFSACMISLISYRYERKKAEKKRSFEELKEGIRYIRENPAVKLLILIFSCVMLFVGGLNVAYPIYVRDVMKMNISAYSLLEVLYGIGTIVGSITIGFIAGKISSARALLSGIMGIGVMILLLGLYPIAIVAFIFGGFFIGFFVGFINAPATTILQRCVEEEFRGRVFGAQGAIIQGSMLISILVIGFLISLVGIFFVIYLTAIVLIFLSLFTLLLRGDKILDEH